MKNSQREHLIESGDFFFFEKLRSCCLSNKGQADVKHRSLLRVCLPSDSTKGQGLSQVFPNVRQAQSVQILGREPHTRSSSKALRTGREIAVRGIIQ